MELGEIVLIIFFLAFLSECPTGSVAAQLCPVRAEPVYPVEVNGVERCSCKHPFFGKNCRFKEQNGTVVLNATRISNELAMISWSEKEYPTEERRYLISVRKIYFKLSNILFAKWRKVAIEDPIMNESTEIGDVSSLQPVYSTVLRLPSTSSFEVKITTINTVGDQLGSTSVYVDASNAFVSGQKLSISEKLVDFKNHILESFQDECALKGIVAGTIVGSLGTIILMAFAYVLTRYCHKCKKQRSPGAVVKTKTQDEATSEDAERTSIENLSLTSLMLSLI